MNGGSGEISKRGGWRQGSDRVCEDDTGAAGVRFWGKVSNNLQSIFEDSQTPYQSSLSERGPDEKTGVWNPGKRGGPPSPRRKNARKRVRRWPTGLCL